MCNAVLFAPRNNRRDDPEDEETFKTREDQFAQQDEYEYVYTFARRDQESLWIFHIIAKSPEDNRFAFSYDNLGVEAWEGSGKMEEANKRFVKLRAAFEEQRAGRGSSCGEVRYKIVFGAIHDVFTCSVPRRMFKLDQEDKNELGDQRRSKPYLAKFFQNASNWVPPWRSQWPRTPCRTCQG